MFTLPQKNKNHNENIAIANVLEDYDFVLKKRNIAILFALAQPRKKTWPIV
jgi:hypothetical protein